MANLRVWGIVISLLLVVATTGSDIFAPVGNRVLLSIPDVSGARKVMAVGEVTSPFGPKVGDTVFLDNSACKSTPAGFSGCVVPDQLILGKLPQASNTPPQVRNATVRGFVTADSRLYATIVNINSTKQRIPITISGASGSVFQTYAEYNKENDWFVYEATVPADDVYVSTTTFGKDDLLALGVNNSAVQSSTAPWSGRAKENDLQNGFVDIVASSPYLNDDACSIWVTLTHDKSARLRAFFVSGLSTRVSGHSTGWHDTLTSDSVSGVKAEHFNSQSQLIQSKTVPDFSFTSSATNSSWIRRYSSVFIPPRTGIYHFYVVANDSVVQLKFQDRTVLIGAGHISFYLMHGSLVPVSIVASSSNNGAGAFLLKVAFESEIATEITTGQPYQRSFVPDMPFSVYVLAEGISSWDASLAQAYLFLGTKHEVARVSLNLYPQPLPQSKPVLTSSFVNSVPVWHVADFDPRRGITVVNKIVPNPYVAGFYLA
eukprot:TRINITY_DN17564_c0_g1_i1.p1 TRINITY_DN17564_c0_g1~~TRINITY_DN17564_c0_g1_i1.p1  ORF type:complete len:487 (+),score=53.92 TRINITY_DN17564_c0_g1_i1:360-1820(+)